MDDFNIGYYGITHPPAAGLPRTSHSTQFNSLFSRESLRRNVYLFNSLSSTMELPVKTILRERRVAAITTDPIAVAEVRSE